MQNQLKQIFVPIEIAKLARQKGFDQWCVCKFGDHLCSGHAEFYGNTDGEGTFLYEYDNGIDDNQDLSIPTHTQLIMWLVERHSIEVQLQMNGLFTVCDAIGGTLWLDDENHFEINDAIFHALNLL